MELGCTVEELLSRVSSYELTEWAAFEELNGPLGGRRHDIHAAAIQTTLANLLGKKRKKLDDFLIKWSRTRRRMSPTEMLNAVRGINRRINRGIARKARNGNP